jgi:hypothetical protein
MPDHRMRVVCPRCTQPIIDTTAREWEAGGGNADTFAAAVPVLITAHEDTCVPLKPVLTARMRRRRRTWWLAESLPLAILAAVNVQIYTEDLMHGWVLTMTLFCLAVAVFFSRFTAYRTGYVRGYHGGATHQPRWSWRYLHPADGIHDPADGTDVNVGVSSTPIED